LASCHTLSSLPLFADKHNSNSTDRGALHRRHAVKTKLHSEEFTPPLRHTEIGTVSLSACSKCVRISEEVGLNPNPNPSRSLPHSKQQTFYLFPVREPIRFKVATFVFKVNSIAQPAYLHSLLLPVLSACSLPSATSSTFLNAIGSHVQCNKIWLYVGNGAR